MNAVDKLLTFGKAMLYFKRLCDIDVTIYHPIYHVTAADMQPTIYMQ